MVIGIDFQGMTDHDVMKLSTLFDTFDMKHTDIRVYKYSTPKSKAINAADVRNSGLPFTSIKMVSFKDYSLRSNDMFDAVMEDGPDVIFFTKDWDVALMLENQIVGTMMYG
jgi:hypothetical protein